MLPISLRQLIQRKAPSARRESGRIRRSRLFDLRPELLEGRITPAGGITITGASMVTAGGSPLSTINIGETVDVKVNYSTNNLPAGSTYSINFEVNGLILNSGPLTSGAGGSGTQSFSINSNAYGADFIATPGTNNLIVSSSNASNTFNSTFNAVGPAQNGGFVYYTTAQMRQAYGLNLLQPVGSVPADGTGQTIAIVDAYNDPNAFTDLDVFDQSMSLSTTSSVSLFQQYGASSSFLSVYNQAGANISANIANSGSGGVPQQDSGWDGEITLDIEWAHSIAPGAKIALVEANDNFGTDLYDTDATAAKLPGVSVVSNSYGQDESQSQLMLDADFTTPSGHQGVTFLASTGDDGAPGGYPAYSPNVIAVGGTQLTLSNQGYGGETVWNLPTPRTLNNGSSSYSQSGSWSSQSGGYSGSYSTAAAGSSASATWTTSITGADQGNGGETAVSVTWKASPSNATKAIYTVYDGSSSGGQVLGTVTVDQTKAPVGTPEGNSQFQELGQFASSTGTLTIVLNANTANGRVVADAVGIASAAADGGGISTIEPEPSYQRSVQNTGFRTIPDVSFDASDYSGVVVYEADGGGYENGVAGTSLACPCFAGLIAIVNQERVATGGATFNSPTNPTEAQTAIYSLPSTDFHDITSGYNGFPAGPGYDEATGLGSPIANLLIPDLAIYGNSDQLAVTTQPPGSVAAGTAFGLTIAVETPNGQPVNSYNGPVTISLGSNPGSGVLNGTLTVNAINGVATFSGLTLDTVGSGYTIQAVASGLSNGVSQPFSVIAGSPSALVISTQPPSIVTAGAPFGLAVTVEDAFGNPITTDNGNVTIALGTNPGSGTLGGTLTVSAVNGVATFSGLTLTRAGSGYTLTISRDGLAGGTTNPIGVVASTPSQLGVILPPQSSVVAGSIFSLEVAIEDLYGNIETQASSTPVTISLQVGAGPLQGSTTMMTTNGVANFTNLVDVKASTIALQFTSPNLTGAISSYIIVSPGPATQLVIQNQPSATATVGQLFQIQPLIYEEDAYGNIVSTDNNSVLTVSLASGSGLLLGSTSSVISNGTVRFTDLKDNQGGTISLKFAVGSIRSAVSSSIVVTKLLPTIAISSTATATYKQATTFSILVSPVSGGSTPTGSVSLYDGSTLLATSTLNASGQATITTNALPLGTQAITVKYSGDSIEASATSAVTSLYVGDLPTGDFSGSGKSDLAVFGYNPNYGKYGFTIVSAASGFKTTTFFDNGGVGYGNSTSIPVVGDYFGDGRDSYALWTPNSLGGMTFTAVSPVNGKSIIENFGGQNMIPVVADVDGDGKSDFGVYGFFPGSGYSFDILLSSKNFATNQQYLFNNGAGYGNSTSIPIVADFDGSGKAGFGVYTPSSTGSTFAFVDPSTSTSFIKVIPTSLSTAGDVPMAVEYDGDGKADLALYGPDPSHAGQYRFLVLTSSTNFNPTQAVFYNNNGAGYGNSAAIPVMANYDGTGKADFAVFLPDYTGGSEFVFQYNQTGAGGISDFATLSEVPLTASTYLIAKKVRGH